LSTEAWKENEGLIASERSDAGWPTVMVEARVVEDLAQMRMIFEGDIEKILPPVEQITAFLEHVNGASNVLARMAGVLDNVLAQYNHMSKSQFIFYTNLLASLFLLSLARAGETKLVIVDNDFTGPPDTLSDLRSALMFLENPNSKVLGFTVVTGDGWRNEEIAHLLRLEEIASRSDVPVIPGAVTPLVNTLQDTHAWEKRYQHISYKGAWDTKEERPWEPDYNPHEIDIVPPIPEGLPSLQPAQGFAAEFTIRQVHAHPHEISILAGGPLTDIALAVRTDPEFASLVKELVFLGAVRPPTSPDFNTRFDPEAARIVVGAHWPSITAVCEVTYHIKLEKADIDKISAAHTPIGDFVVKYSRLDVGKTNLWDEICAAVLIDPTLITNSDDQYVDIVVDHQKDYGAVRLDSNNPLIEGQCKLRIVNAIDVGRFKSQFVDSMTGLNAKASSN
jgi:inosine-uridine nucleoside N-ribohydrolase